MEEWKKIQKTYKIRELIGITGMIMSFVIGAICDWNGDRFKFCVNV